MVGAGTAAIVTGVQIGGVGADVTLNVNINGKTYLSNAIPANTGGGSNEIAANTTITLTEATTGTSFQIQTGAARVIASSADLNQFAADVDGALTGVTFAQKRNITTFDQTKATGTTLNGLTSTNVELKSSAYNAFTGTHGKLTDFVVTAVTGPGNSDGTISVKIDGETFTATGLGSAGGDTHTANITLTSASGKEFKLNILDAAVTLNFSSNLNAKTIQKDLNTTFGVGVNINLVEGDDLEDIAGKINSQSSTSNVTASVIKVADNDYRLSIQSSLTGIENAYKINDVIDDTFTSTVVFNPIQVEQDASIEFNGQTITRSTNSITDIVKGVNFNLFQETPLATTLKVDIDKNVAAVKDTIKELVTLYNDFKSFAAEQQLVNEDGTVDEKAFLKDSKVLNNSLTSLGSEISRIVNGILSGNPRALADAGITLVDIPGDDAADPPTPTVKNALFLDETKLVSLLSSNFEGVRKVFEFDFNSSQNDKIQVYSRTNALTISAIESLDIDVGRATGDQVRVTYKDSDGILRVINADYTANSQGGLISGQSGTVIEGLKLTYVGDGTDIITDVKFTQGIADRLYNVVDPTVISGGTIDSEVEDLNEENTRLTSDIARIDDQVAFYRDNLIRKFGALERLISKANNALAFLEADSAARKGNT